MAIESIAKTLGSGSGIDIGALVTSLVEAQFAAKTKTLEQREEKLDAQISGVSKVKSAVTGLDQALRSLVKGGTLASKLTSSNEAAIKVSRPDATATGDVSASIGVTQIASNQVSATNTPVERTAAFRTGTLTLRFGSDVVNTEGAVTGFTPAGSSINIAITNADATLDGIAAKINAANAGLTAKVVPDGTGARLAISGPSGADKAFEIAAANSGFTGQSLANLVVNRTATTTTSVNRARDAIVTVDGVRFTRATNTITDLVPGAKLELTGPSTAPVAIGTAKPTAALLEAVNNFVGAFNETMTIVREANDPMTGALRSDNAVEGLARSLGRLTTTPLLPPEAAGGPRTLADIGIATARDGSLSVDSVRLAKAMADFPTAVERMFADGVDATDAGLTGALGAVVKNATGRIAGLEASTVTYNKQKAALADAKAKAADQASALKERLTRQFATMDARAAAYKSTQTFLDNQIKAWNRSDA